jgi:hypothetical protein
VTPCSQVGKTGSNVLNDPLASTSPPEAGGCRILRNVTYTDTTRRTQQLRSQRSGVSRILRNSELRVHTINYTNVKFHPRTGHKGPAGERGGYSCTLSLTSTPDGVGDQPHASAALPPGKTRYPLYRRWVGPSAGLDRCGRCPPRFHSWTVQAV